MRLKRYLLLLLVVIQNSIGHAQPPINSTQFESLQELADGVDTLSIPRLDISQALKELELLQKELTSGREFDHVILFFQNRSQLGHTGQNYWVLGINKKSGLYLGRIGSNMTIQKNKLTKIELKEIQAIISKIRDDKHYLQAANFRTNYQQLLILRKVDSEASIFTITEFVSGDKRGFPSKFLADLGTHMMIYY